jgi:hypothetical protein
MTRRPDSGDRTARHTQDQRGGTRDPSRRTYGGDHLAAEWVVEWCAGGVDDRWGDELDVARADQNLPASAMHMPVVCFAQQNAVVDAGVTAVGPVVAMVSLAQSR